jgi:hypothetical protein
MIEVDERVHRPELAAQLLSSNQFSRSFKQRREQLKRLFLELYLLAPLAQFPGAKIDLESTERIIRDEELADTGTSIWPKFSTFRYSPDVCSSAARL